MPRIVTLTLNPAVDKSSTVDQVVAERKLRCSEPVFDPGGGGLNVARAIRELGGEAEAYWTCGGAVGVLLQQLLDDRQIPNTPIPIAAMTRENLVVYEDASGQQYRFGMPGAHLTESEIADCMARLRAIDPPPEYLVLSGSLPPSVDEDLYARFAGMFGKDCRVVLDTSGGPLKKGLEGKLFLIKPNIRELGQLAGESIEDDAQIHAVARGLIDAGYVEVVVTSLGSGGVAMTTADQHEHVRAPTVKIRSKVGAGDSTVAGIVIALSRGKSILDAVRFGVSAGSAAVMTDGTELCRREDVERLYEQNFSGDAT